MVLLGMLARCAPAAPHAEYVPPDPAFDITYVDGWPAAAVDEEFAIFYFDCELGWGFVNRANRWHAAPEFASAIAPALDVYVSQATYW